MAYEEHNKDNQECPVNDPDAVFGNQCICRNPNEVGNLAGKELLDAITTAWNKGHYKGWTYEEMVRGPSVLPMSVFDEKSSDHRFIRHQCIVSTGLASGRITDMTLMVTTPEGTTYQEFIPKGPPTDTP